VHLLRDRAGLLSDEARGTGALSGLRVLDLTKFWAGPAVTEALGNMGAQVIKVEAAHALDPWRLGGARQTVESSEDGPTYEFSSIFNAVNRNKYGLTLDLSQPRGREILRQLLVTTDVLAENYAPRVMAKFGLGYESLRQINPRLVMISLPAFGSTGPWRDYVGFAYPTEQAAGFPHFTGYTDGEPMLWGCAAGDAIAGMLGLVGVLAAVNWARETGEGQHVDVSQVEALSTFLGPPMIDYSWHRRSWPRCGNADPARAPQGCYPTAGDDTWMVVSAEDDEQWRALCRVLHRDDWLGRAGLASVAGRSAARAELDAGIALWTSSREARTASAELQDAGVAAAPVMGGYDLLADPHLAARGFIEWINREHVGTLAHTGMWAKFSRTPGTIRRPAPTLGQHNQQVLSELLGLSPADLAELESNGVIGTQAAGSRSPRP